MSGFNGMNGMNGMSGIAGLVGPDNTGSVPLLFRPLLISPGTTPLTGLPSGALVYPGDRWPPLACDWKVMPSVGFRD